MNKKIKFILLCIAGLFIASAFITKKIIWSDAAFTKDGFVTKKSQIGLITKQGDSYTRPLRYTTSFKQKVFNFADNLFTPAFLLLFIMTAVKFIGIKEPFEEGE